DDVEPHRLPAPPATHQHAAAGTGVFDGVGHQVLDDARQEHAVRTHDQRSADDAQLDVLFARERLELDLDFPEQIEDVDIGAGDLERTRIHARDVEQGRHDVLDGVEGRIDRGGKLGGRGA